MRFSTQAIFCIRSLAERAKSNYEISKEARQEGINTRRYPYEWADAYLLRLRKDGLAIRNGKAPDGRAAHKLTDAGREISAQIGGAA